MTPFEFLPHTADIRVSMTGATWPDLLQSAIDALRSLFVGTSATRAAESRMVVVTHHETDELFFRFLRELVYLYETELFVPVTLEMMDAVPHHIRATLRGEQLDTARHRAEPEIKAVTRHGLIVTRSAEGWRAEVVFDV